MEVIGQLKQGKKPDSALYTSDESKQPEVLGKRKATIRNQYSPQQQAIVVKRYNELLKTYKERAARNLLYAEFSNIKRSTIRNWLNPDKQSNLLFVATGKKHRKERRLWKSKKKAKYPKEEDKLWDKFKLQRIERLPVNREWIQATMLNLLKESKPEGYLKFKASPGWATKWCYRYKVSLRMATNSKPKNVLERLPEVKSFHRKAKAFRKTGTQRCATYGRFPPRWTFSGIFVPLTYLC